MWLMEYTVTPHTYMLTALPCPARGEKGSLARDRELYSCSGGCPDGVAGPASAVGASAATLTSVLLHLRHTSPITYTNFRQVSHADAWSRPLKHEPGAARKEMHLRRNTERAATQTGASQTVWHQLCKPRAAIRNHVLVYLLSVLNVAGAGCFGPIGLHGLCSGCLGMADGGAATCALPRRRA